MAPVYVFDAYGTLFDVHSAVDLHRHRVGADADAVSALWRSKQLEYTWVRTLAGAPFRDFRQLTGEALDAALSRYPDVDPSVREALLEAYDHLRAYPDAAPALERLKQAGLRTAILSNGSVSMLASAVGASGLESLLDATISVDQAGRYKTSPDAYRLVLDAFGCEPADVIFHSSNRWDIAGACRAGFSTVWINRSGAADEYPDCPPDRVLAGLDQLLVGKLLAPPPSGR